LAGGEGNGGELEGGETRSALENGGLAEEGFLVVFIVEEVSEKF